MAGGHARAAGGSPSAVRVAAGGARAGLCGAARGREAARPVASRAGRGAAVRGRGRPAAAAGGRRAGAGGAPSAGRSIGAVGCGLVSGVHGSACGPGGSRRLRSGQRQGIVRLCPGGGHVHRPGGDSHRQRRGSGPDRARRGAVSGRSAARGPGRRPCGSSRSTRWPSRRSGAAWMPLPLSGRRSPGTCDTNVCRAILRAAAH